MPETRDSAAGAGDGTRRRGQEDPGGQVRRARDAAMALPFLGVLLLASPLTGAFAMEGRLLGIPVVVVYVFLAWALLIYGAWRVSQRMLATGAEQPRRRG